MLEFGNNENQGVLRLLSLDVTGLSRKIDERICMSLSRALKYLLLMSSNEAGEIAIRVDAERVTRLGSFLQHKVKRAPKIPKSTNKTAKKTAKKTSQQHTQKAQNSIGNSQPVL